VNDNGREPPRNLDDGDLAAMVAAGDAAAFGLIYDRYAGAVYALTVHLLGTMEAEEVVQEVFLSLWRKAHQFDATRGSFAAWFMSIARHRALRVLRARNRQRRIQAVEEIDQLLAHASAETVDVEEQAWQQERGRAALSALSRLPAEQRQVIVLAYFGGLSQSAIAQQLNLPLGTVKKRVRLGMQKLRLAIGEQLLSEHPRDDSISPRHG
jgi:RNA polymerase sigma-70 factor, ECF subfamily